ncbi:MAG: MMPL family transporter [Myxococcota bacterium]|nr:MMPL family transporter [Myxococcota bacterium]
MKIRQRCFDGLANLAASRPWIVVCCGLILTILSLLVSSNLKLETRILDLVPSDDPAALEYNDIVRQYSAASQIMIGIKGDDPTQMIGFADALEKRAQQAVFTDSKTGKRTPYVKRITVRADVDFIAEHGLMLTKKRDLNNLETLFKDLTLAPLLSAYNDFLEQEYIEDSGAVTEREKEDQAIDGLKNIHFWLGGISNPRLADKATTLLAMGNPYLFSDDDRLLIALVTPAISIDRIEETMDGVRSLRDDVIEVIKKDYSGLDVRMTGMPALALEEGEVAYSDMGASSLISLVLVCALFILAFRMWTAPLLAIINLVLSIIWTMGFIGLTVGRLNLFTLMFGVILIGLGIDFAIHLNAAFATARSQGEGGKSIAQALRQMFMRSGAGVVTGAITTSAAFFALALTGLDALVELGLVLGAGILLTLIASLTVLPAMYAIHARVGNRLAQGNTAEPKPVRLTFPFLARMGVLIERRPWPMLLGCLIVTAGFVVASRNAEFEPDMLEIEPPDMPSVVLHREILDQFELNPDYAMVTSESLEKTRPIVKKLKKNRLIGRVEAITEFVPSEKEQRTRAPIINRIRAQMKPFIWPPTPPSNTDEAGDPKPPPFMTRPSVPNAQAAQLLTELNRLEMNVREIGQLAFASVKERLRRACDRLTNGEDAGSLTIGQLKQQLQKTADLPQKMAHYEKAYVPLLAQKIAKMADTSPITVNTLPASIRDRYLSSEGKNLITIYSAVDLWKEGKVDLFLKAAQKASDRVTGTAVLIDRLIALIGSKGLIATLLALGAVFVILLIDFRSLGYAILGMTPLVVGFTWMVGIFVLLGKKFDVANLEAIPLILGIGIDDAVHVLHAVRRQGVRALPEVLRHTGRALLLTSLTTGIAFGSIAFASHRGLAGMGLLLVLGVVSCFIASVVLLPALARIFLNNKQSNDQTKEVTHA